jgi:hypothetical protein
MTLIIQRGVSIKHIQYQYGKRKTLGVVLIYSWISKCRNPNIQNKKNVTYQSIIIFINIMSWFIACLLQVFASYLAFCGIGLKNAQLYERSLLENRRSQVKNIYNVYFVCVTRNTLCFVVVVFWVKKC